MISINKLQELIEAMTLEEKVNMLHGNGIFETKGIKRLNIPPLVMSDGPMGVRNEFTKDSWIPKNTTDDYVSYFLSNTALAATWNPALAYTFGQDLGSESRSRGKNIILAPGINIIRSPLCGRNFEYMSEDPYLTKKMALPIINGIQENDVAACLKHFVVNNQETNRLTVNIEVNDQALEEIYFPAFKAALTEGHCYSVMGAYNKLRDEYCCESKFLLQEVLKDRWKFDGVVISDWGACHSTKKAALNGLDIEMSVTTDYDEYYFGSNLYDLVSAGEISESTINDKILRVLILMNNINMLDGSQQKGQRNCHKHQEDILQAAQESIVLLSNRNNFLPLNTDLFKSIAIIGDNGNLQHSNGGGSAAIKALYEHTPLAGISMYLGNSKKLTYVQGYTSDVDATDEVAFNLRQEALRIVEGHDIIIFIGGLNHDFDTEGRDRTNYQLPYQQDLLIKELAKVNENIVAINISGSAVDLSALENHSKALIQTWYNGMEGGLALAHVLFGQVNPSGKLPFTIAKNLNDYSSHSTADNPYQDTIHYHEGIYVGYRHFDSNNINPLYPFGHGLSYTTFDYSDLSIQQDQEIIVSLYITNNGNCQGKEVVQLYSSAIASKGNRPDKELKGFKKVSLKPTEKQKVTFEMSYEDFAYYNQDSASWLIEPTTINILIGSSSRDIRLEKSFLIPENVIK